MKETAEEAIENNLHHYETMKSLFCKCECSLQEGVYSSFQNSPQYMLLMQMYQKKGHKYFIQKGT